MNPGGQRARMPRGSLAGQGVRLMKRSRGCKPGRVPADHDGNTRNSRKEMT